MYYVYILLMDNKQLYTGYTNDLERRIAEHEASHVSSTKLKRPVKLIHYEAYTKESDARRREKFLKKSEGKKYLKQQIRDLLKEIEN